MAGVRTRRQDRVSVTGLSSTRLQKLPRRPSARSTDSGYRTKSSRYAATTTTVRISFNCSRCCPVVWHYWLASHDVLILTGTQSRFIYLSWRVCPQFAAADLSCWKLFLDKWFHVSPADSGWSSTDKVTSLRGVGRNSLPPFSSPPLPLSFPYSFLPLDVGPLKTVRRSGGTL